MQRRSNLMSAAKREGEKWIIAGLKTVKEGKNNRELFDKGETPVGKEEKKEKEKKRRNLRKHLLKREGGGKGREGNVSAECVTHGGRSKSGKKTTAHICVKKGKGG